MSWYVVGVAGGVHFNKSKSDMPTSLLTSMLQPRLTVAVRFMPCSIVRDGAEELQIIFSLIKRQVKLRAAFPWLWAHRTAAPMSPL